MSNSRQTGLIILYVIYFGFTQTACSDSNEVHKINSGRLTVEINAQMKSRIDSGPDLMTGIEKQFSYSEFAIVNGVPIMDFSLSKNITRDISGLLGDGQQYTFIGESENGLEKQVEVSRYDEFTDMMTFRVSYQNNSSTQMMINKWVNNAHVIAVSNEIEPFWSFQGASYEDRRDWVLPLEVGFSQDNYLGMNATDYGGGTPVSDVWRDDFGIAVGHLETVPKLVSLPVRFVDVMKGAELSVEYEYDFALAPGESMSTFETFVFLHEGDYYATLKNYRKVMARKGLIMNKSPDSAYEPVWCAWGYERDFDVGDIIKTLPKASEMGLKWAVLDDGWQTAEGDWYLNPDKFPNGDADMQSFVSEINKAGLKAKLWWAPLAVDPGTDLIAEHEDMLLLNEDGSPVKITWWDSYYLCPAYDKTIEYSNQLVLKILGEWGYQGLKIDGQHLNGVPKCYNPKHHHERPEESVEGLQQFWARIYQTALEIDKENVIEICPCGTSYAFFNLPYMNQSVSSDPLSSWQVRLKGKTLKALSGESAAYYGDHVELSDGQSDFASSFGIGAVLGTKFTIPAENIASQEFVLTEAKEIEWRKWIGLYNKMMLPKGEYLGELYDIGFDRPETHAIRKGDSVYYAFYADKYNGKIELRGLASGPYHLIDYISGRELGSVSGPGASLSIDFENFLLMEAIPDVR